MTSAAIIIEQERGKAINDRLLVAVRVRVLPRVYWIPISGGHATAGGWMLCLMPEYSASII